MNRSRIALVGLIGLLVLIVAYWVLIAPPVPSPVGIKEVGSKQLQPASPAPLVGVQPEDATREVQPMPLPAVPVASEQTDAPELNSENQEQPLDEEEGTQVLIEIIKEGAVDVSKCYSRALARTPDLNGRIDFHLVAERGQLIDVNWVEDETYDDIFVTCIEDSLIGLEASSPFSGELNWPFVFLSNTPEEE